MNTPMYSPPWPSASMTSPRPRLGAVHATCGFTLIELLVTITVAAILTAIALPAMRTFVQNDRQWTQMNALVMSMNAARSEAIKQDVANGVFVCPSANGLTCSNAAGAWGQGWIVVSSAPGSTPIMSVPAVSTGSTLTEATPLPAVTFLSNGMVAAAAAFTICDSRGP